VSQDQRENPESCTNHNLLLLLLQLLSSYNRMFLNKNNRTTDTQITHTTQHTHSTTQGFTLSGGECGTMCGHRIFPCVFDKWNASIQGHAVPQPTVPICAPVWRHFIHQNHKEIFCDPTCCHTHHLRMWNLV
jgi:hypothetical protein